MKVKAITLGCKVNTYESEYVLSEFKKRGYEIVIDNQESDIYIVNTCSVTNASDAKCRKVINRLIRENKNKIIVVMGCMIEAHQDYDNSSIDLIIGNKDKSKIVDLVEKYLIDNKKRKILYDDFDIEFEDMFIENMSSRTRAFIKIQDGCENFCSYCIIPYTRGKQRSKKKEVVLNEIKKLISNGYKEIVLTGIHTGNYGVDIGTTFKDLLQEIVNIKGLIRLRISSIEITELNDEFFNILEKYPVIVSHLHIPLQSGSDSILKLMNRKYDTNYFFDKIERIRKIRPDISITTDIIVGFPFETDELFNETLKFVKKIKFSKIHVFPYSKRENTKASLMSNQVDEGIKKERVKELIKISSELEKEYISSFINKEVDVLIEGFDIYTSWGHTTNYIKVIIDSKVNSNTIVKVKIIKRNGLELIGHIVGGENEGN